MQLFCFAHAGSSALNYYQWKKNINKNIEIIPIELAGRGEKQSLSPRLTMDEVIQDVMIDFLQSYTGENYAFFGHSLGAWIVYELYDYLNNSSYPLPKSIFFSGNCPPFFQKSPYVRMNMTDKEFMDKLISLGGMSNQILLDETLYNTYKQILRADFQIAETYSLTAVERKISCDIIALGGTEDFGVTSEDLMGWKKIALGKCTIRKVKGNHFFPFTNSKETVDIINNQLFY